jgi:hypothetical protein
MKFVKSFLLILSSVMLFSQGVIAQSNTIREKQIELHKALCEQRWVTAGQIIDQMRSASSISIEYRTELFLLGLKVQDLRDGKTQPFGLPGCNGQENLISVNQKVNWSTAQKDIESGMYTIGVNYVSSSSSGGGLSISSRSSGNCDRPSDLASDGSQCGGRAASERSGGR